MMNERACLSALRGISAPAAAILDRYTHEQALWVPVAAFQQFLHSLSRERESAASRPARGGIDGADGSAQPRLRFPAQLLPPSRARDEEVRSMSMEMEAVISSCVAMLQSNPQMTREEVARLLNRWEELGYISRQMRAVIVQRLRENQQSGQAPGKAQE